MRASIDEFLALGVIRHSKSKFAAPALMVLKDEAKPRMVINFKALNACTTSDAYPMPKVDETLYNLKDQKFFSSMDANKGFYQLPVHPDHIERTAFTTPFGLYEFVRMPMGLKNSPATFQRAMDSHFHVALREGWFSVYIDDLMLKSLSFDEHLVHLQRALATLDRYGWTMSPSKCYFGHSSVRQLGHRVSGVLLGINENKVAAVRDWAVPRNRKTLMTFLGFAGYFRKFIRDYGAIARPLTKLVSPTSTWNFTDECIAAFNEIRKRLLAAPLLAQPDFTLPFRVYVDACGDGLGAVLQQVQRIDGADREVVICFISRQLRGAEERYGATQLECLALVWALNKLHVFLDGCQFEVVTDCVAIRSLLTLKTPNRHMLRWQLAVQEYSGLMTIVHRAGATHGNADGLSRQPLPNDASNPASDLSNEPEPAVHAVSTSEDAPASTSMQALSSALCSAGLDNRSNPAADGEDHLDTVGVHAVSFAELNDEYFDRVKASYAEVPELNSIYALLSRPDEEVAGHLAALSRKLREEYKAGR
ncbi:MAG: reverse transcriptase family protein, partial [Pseudomonas amygdali]